MSSDCALILKGLRLNDHTPKEVRMPSLTSMLLSNQPLVGDYGCFSVVERLELCAAAPFDYAVENRFSHTVT